MQVSSYLEAFLTVYGWDMYSVLYLLFAMTGLFLYPFLRIVSDVYISYIGSNEYAGTNYLRQLIASMVIAGLVYFVALVPVVGIDLNSTTVKTICEEKKDVESKNKLAKNINGSTYFTTKETKVPMMPWLAMALGQGIAGVIYNETPCVLDVTDTKKAMMNLHFEDSENSELLKSELNDFVNDCHMKAVKLTKDILKDASGGAYGQQAYTILKSQLDSIESSTGKSEKQILGNYDSEFLRKMFYEKSAGLNATPENNTLTPLLASKSVVGYSGYEKNTGSQIQKATPPSCKQWWYDGDGSTKALRLRVLEGLTAAAITNVAKNSKIPECETKIFYTKGINMAHIVPVNPTACKNEVVRQIYSGNSSKFDGDIFSRLQDGGATDRIAGGWENAGLLAGIAGGIASLFGKDFGQSQVIGSLTGFYMTILILHTLLRYLLPMILMAIYMFWGVFMVVGEFRGMTMIKGMILITALSLIPALWAVMEHLDDGLYQALYGGWDMQNPADRLFLDVATSIFQITIVFLLFFLIGEAGGGNAKGAVEPSQISANKIGGSAGTSVGNAGTQSMFGKSDNKGGLSGGFLPKLGGGIRGGFRKSK